MVPRTWSRSNAGYEFDTPLSRAALAGSEEVIELLLSHGGNVSRGQVLQWAVEREDDTNTIVELLLRRGAQPNCLEYGGEFPAWCVLGRLKTPLHKAVALGKLDVVTTLLKYGADASMEDSVGRKAVEIARGSGNVAIASVLSSRDT